MTNEENGRNRKNIRGRSMRRETPLSNGNDVSGLE